MSTQETKIQFTRAYLCDGKPFATLEGAQLSALTAIYNKDGLPSPEVYAGSTLAHKEEILNILTTTPKSRPRARAINGGRKSRRNAPAAPVTTAVTA